MFLDVRAMEFIVRRHCSIASAGCARKRSSSLSNSALTFLSASLSFIKPVTICSSTLINGSSTSVVTILNSEFTVATLTGVIILLFTGRSKMRSAP